MSTLKSIGFGNFIGNERAMEYKEFYSELGKLLYAVAHSSGQVEEEEVKRLHALVKNYLVPQEKHNDEFGTDAAWYTEIGFDFSTFNDLDAKAAFDSFIDYIHEHHNALDKQMRAVGLMLAEEVANSANGLSAAEGKILKELKDKLSRVDA